MAYVSLLTWYQPFTICICEPQLFFGAKAARMFCNFRLFLSSKYIRTCRLPCKEDQSTSKSQSKSETISGSTSQCFVGWHLKFGTSTASRRAVRHLLSTTEEPEDKEAVFWDPTSTISKWNSRCAANGKHECRLRYIWVPYVDARKRYLSPASFFVRCFGQ